MIDSVEGGPELVPIFEAVWRELYRALKRWNSVIGVLFVPKNHTEVVPRRRISRLQSDSPTEVLLCFRGLFQDSIEKSDLILKFSRLRLRFGSFAVRVKC